jgi:hypothetical protein
MRATLFARFRGACAHDRHRGAHSDQCAALVPIALRGSVYETVGLTANVT